MEIHSDGPTKPFNPYKVDHCCHSMHDYNYTKGRFEKINK